jgi:eukaryotic-like serine/threonine-protein kinase
MYPQVFGKYVLEKELARGGMARLLLATLRGAGGFEKKLVVKQIRDELASDDEFVRRFVQEAKTTVALAHPNIVPVYELGVELGTYFLAMELVEGASLAEVLRTHRKLTPDEGAYVGVEVCRALDYAHRRMSVVHGDVTPRNVMVDEEGQVKVIDFGISAPVATAPSGHGVFGSPGHMPPEQMAGKQLTPAADVFAVAVLLMELWSGRPVFRRRTNEEIDAALRDGHPRPSDVDIRLLPLDDIFASAMSLDPLTRPQNAEDLARALRKFLSGMDVHDVAHKLGDRVREVRTAPSPPAGDDRPLLQRPPSRPTGTPIATKTFAARDEVSEWREPNTRKLSSSKPTTKSPDGETIATKPIETDPKRAAPPPRRRTAVWLAGLGAAAVGGGAYLVTRGTWDRPVPSAPSAASVAASAPSRGAPPVEVAPRETTSSAAPSPGPPPSAAPAGEKATLSLLGDGTMVSIDGNSRGNAPVHVTLEPGNHVVVFTFPATGESKGSRVSLHAGERATMRADFTGATPVIRVARP